MATNETLQKYGTALLFADATDFPNSGAGPPTTGANDIRIGTGTKVQIDLTNVLAAAARESDKIATIAKVAPAWPGRWRLAACIENETAPAAGGTVDFYWASSPNSSAATGNPGNVVGADGVFAIAGNTQLELIGSLTVLNQVVNIDTKIGTFGMSDLYGSLIVVNNTSTGFRTSATAMDETHIVIVPLIDDVQASA